MNMSSLNTLSPNTWVENHGDFLFNYASGRIYNQETAEDIVQETFLSAYKARNNFKGKSSERTWLVSILKNKIIDFYRKKANNPELSDYDFELETDQDDSPFISEGAFKGHWKDGQGPGNWHLSALSKMESEEFYAVLHLCLSLLPVKWSSAFSLKFLEDLESEKVCKHLNISASNLWVIMHRARLQLRVCMDKNWED
ncbi:MAG: sigma-70 family RNA polymerase sigma factor [Bacteroidetes bacterium]|jgi:RNA polymerase sigma-70 factor (TIGR02943 family)|nr:sigma-70 family RNA polymerase sigma factor [Bacteroidota bacterium]MBT5529780.1 sigma-70 family RNA polymerase sigma factor [Cytophagia bacterium]MBT4968920.1 sigma-70 family RNA polymerase sigma factor [Bacteroidota bacterium]MBT5992228.1 sigma-70 family RNA polymerase sigma factor [Bacteroidota bacterium]MBT6836265.1 sigma-70 family RNA polymerase sigma factor [Bacteroidota bacterium]